MKNAIYRFIAPKHQTYMNYLILIMVWLAISTQAMAQNCQNITFYLGEPEALNQSNNSYRIRVKADIINPASQSFLLRGMFLTITANSDIGSPTILAAQAVSPIISTIQGSGGSRTLIYSVSNAVTISDNATLFFIDVTGVPAATLTASLSQGVVAPPVIVYTGAVATPRCETGILGSTITRPSIVSCSIAGATMYGSTKMANPSGYCFDYSQQSTFVSDIQMTVTDMLTSPLSPVATFTTDPNGPWQFTGTPGGFYRVAAQPTTGPFPLSFHQCGLEDDPNPNNYGDLQMIFRHVGGIEPFQYAWQHFAADVSNSNSITTFDMTLIRKVMLNQSGATSLFVPWKVYPEHAVEQAQALLDNNQSPFVTFSNFIQLNPLEDGAQPTYFALKMGDVNGSCIDCSHLGIMAEPEERSYPAIGESTILLPEISGKSGDIVDFPVFSGVENTCLMLNLNLNFDPAYMEIVECSPSDRFGLAVVDGNSLRYSYLDIDDLAKTGTIRTGQQLFSVKLRLLHDVESIGTHAEINPSGMASVWLDGPYGKSAPQLKVSGKMNTGAPVQVWPNPATTWLTVSQEGQPSTAITLYASDGRMVLTQGLDNQAVIDISNLVPGLYTYVINGGKINQTGKLIKE